MVQAPPLRLLSFALLLQFSAICAQNKPESWRVHLPFFRCAHIDFQQGNLLLASDQGAWSYNLQTIERQPFSKAEGFSAVESSVVRAHPSKPWAIITYCSGHVDLIKNGRVIGLNSLLNAGINDSKFIRSAEWFGDTVLLAADFGAVIIDANQEVFRNSAILNNSPQFTTETCQYAAVFNNRFWFALSSGLYSSPLNGNIKDLTSWSLHPDAGPGFYLKLAPFNGKLYAIKGQTGDSLFAIVPGVSAQNLQFPDFPSFNQIRTIGNRLYILTDTVAIAIDPQQSPIWNFHSPFGLFKDIVQDDLGNHYLATSRNGLLFAATNQTAYGPPGPETRNAYDIKVLPNGDVWVATGGRTPLWGAIFRRDQLFYRRQGFWRVLREPEAGYPLGHADLLAIAPDPDNPSRLFVAAGITGLYEINNYDYSSFIQGPPLPMGLNRPGLGGLAFDRQKNLWVAPTYDPIGLLCLKTDNTFSAVDFPNFTSNSVPTGDVVVDDFGHVWLAVWSRGIAVYNPSSGQKQYLTATFNSGDLPNLHIRTLAKDKNGEIWVGTDDGIRVFSPGLLFSGNPINGQKVVLKSDDGNNELLLAQTIVNDIQIDGGNRKWIATQGAGVLLVSPDGRSIIRSFNAANSPLLADNVQCIGIDPVSGEVYFGTELGIISYQGNASEANDQFGEVLAFPNPIKPNYDGPVTIRGLARNAQLKITDVAGNLVYELQADGGTATWNGKRFDGRRPQTGVYLVWATNEDGSESMATKLIFIH
ncbi:MAG: two-component regulator propeller domain-containing protein [Bacteroidia bacterium]